MTVPFVNLVPRTKSRRDEISRTILEVIDSGELSGGRYVDRFEDLFAAYCGTQFAIAVGSGTDALWLTLMAMDIGPGDEVITVPNTFIATVEAIIRAGATPVLVDVSEDSFNMNPELIEPAITSRTKAIIAVHLFGRTAEMEPIMKISRRHGLKVIEDAAQSHGATYKGASAGSLGDAACFSFYPTKNLGALGEGGAVTTNDPAISERIRALRNHGQIAKNCHTLMGWNSRMDGIQAAVLSMKLLNLDSENDLRRSHARAYDAALAQIPGIACPKLPPNGTHVFHIYAIGIADRHELIPELTSNGIGYGIHYPLPIHRQRAYSHLWRSDQSFPVAERCSDTLLSLPMFPELTSYEINQVVSVIRTSALKPVAA